MVRANGAVSLRELARVVQTSEVTVRRDVRALEAEGLLDRRHGGAVLPGGFTRESGFPQKSHLATAEKTAIADLAAGLVDEGEAVVVGAGTTTQELARRLARVPGLTVVTNSLLVAQALAHANRVEVVMTGGTLRGSNYGLVGSGAEQSLQGLRVSRAFLSGAGLTAERGLSTSNMLSASVDRALVHAATEVVVLADHTKLGTDTMFQTVPTELITHLVTGGCASRWHLRRTPPPTPPGVRATTPRCRGPGATPCGPPARTSPPPRAWRTSGTAEGSPAGVSAGVRARVPAGPASSGCGRALTPPARPRGCAGRRRSGTAGGRTARAPRGSSRRPAPARGSA
jgi:DeoR/GlpR family transcriptional regulator of sugar metabolism